MDPESTPALTPFQVPSGEDEPPVDVGAETVLEASQHASVGTAQPPTRIDAPG